MRDEGRDGGAEEERKSGGKGGGALRLKQHCTAGYPLP